jgi:hypothetical protein
VGTVTESSVPLVKISWTSRLLSEVDQIRLGHVDPERDDLRHTAAARPR